MLQSDNNPLRAGPTTQPKTPAIPCSAKNLASAARRHPRVLPATEDTKGEIMGIHRCDKRLRFRHDFFRRGRLAGDRRKSPADRLVRLDVPQLGLSGGSKISRVAGGLRRIKARGQAVNSLSSASNSSRGVSFRCDGLMLPLGAPIPAHAPKASPGRAKCDELVTVNAIFH